VDVRQILGHVARRSLKRLVDLGGIDLVVLMDDLVPQAGAGGDGLGEISGEDVQPL